MKHYLIGASGHAKVILEILQAAQLEIGGLYDDNTTIRTLLNHPVLGNISQLDCHAAAAFIVSIGSNKIRKKIALGQKVNWANAIHPSANISPSAALGLGIVIMAGVAINASTSVGSHAIINTNATVDHDCSIGDFAHISPGVAIAGNVQVGEGTHIGVGACVLPGITIGKWAIVGAGSVVIRNVPDYATVVGNPAKIIKYTAQQH